MNLFPFLELQLYIVTCPNLKCASQLWTNVYTHVISTKIKIQIFSSPQKILSCLFHVISPSKQLLFWFLSYISFLVKLIEMVSYSMHSLFLIPSHLSFHLISLPSWHLFSLSCLLVSLKTPTCPTLGSSTGTYTRQVHKKYFLNDLVR